MSEPDEMAQAFGEFLRAQRRLADISQRQLSKVTGISDSYLSQMERGRYRPSVEVMRSLARAFGLPPSVVYAQFGLMDDEATDGVEAPSVETAIHNDARLTAEHKQMLLQLYRTLAGGPRPGDEGA